MSSSSAPKRRTATIAVAAEYVPCSPKMIRRRIADGSLTGYRMGPRLIRVDLNELDALMRPIPTAGDGARNQGMLLPGAGQVCTPKADAELAAGGR